MLTVDDVAEGAVVIGPCLGVTPWKLVSLLMKNTSWFARYGTVAAP